VRAACRQVRESPKLREVLRLILAIGNYLNGASARGGAYGFKLADLEKLRHVRSNDLSTTLLHYLAKVSRRLPRPPRPPRPPAPARPSAPLLR
jgi:hypothetical protein